MQVTSSVYHLQELARLLTVEQGKPLEESRAEVEWVAKEAVEVLAVLSILKGIINSVQTLPQCSNSV